MKRFLTAIFLSLSFVVIGFIYLFPVSAEKENVIQALLNLPAPPPPNPLAEAPRNRSRDFFDKKHPPADDAPIEDLLDYWKEQSGQYRRLGYNIFPSERSLQRILGEVRRDPSILTGFLGILPDSKETADFVKEIFDGQTSGTELDHSQKKEIKTWLTYHTPYFSSDLARSAEKAGDEREYVSNQEELLSLAGVDWERARPMVDRLYASGRSPSGVLGKWALYRHALLADDLSEIDRYRDELKAVVEDKTATPGMRDLAFDALVKEKDWSGRDEWYYSLLEDETLADLRVNGSSYTGLTTIIMYSPPDKYVDKMIELTNSRNIVVRSAAARNLLLVLDANRPDIVRALLPWLENPKWARDIQSDRQRLVAVLREIKMPESVPGLIAALDEKEKREVPAGSDTPAANTIANRIYRSDVTNSARVSVNSNSVLNTATVKTRSVIDYPFRYLAISALEMQRDSRAAPALRRILAETQSYEAISVIRALIYSHGFSTAEEIEALEAYLISGAQNIQGMALPSVYASNVKPREGDIAMDYITNTAATYGQPNRPPTAIEIKALLGQQIMGLDKPDDDLVAAVIERIKVLDQKDPALASLLKKVVLRWPGPAVNAMALKDLKEGKAETEAIIRLLALRKTLRETQPNELADARSGDSTATGITACLLEDANEYDAILSSQDTKAKTALLACGRLIRAPFQISRVAEGLQSKDKLLATAAERYLESEDSPQARSIVLSLHPDEAKIMGATTSFRAGAVSPLAFGTIQVLFASVDRYFASGPVYDLSGDVNGQEETEKRLQKEVKEDQDLLGIYSYDDNLIRIYKDKAVYVWEEDPSRYRERVLTKDEFQNLTSLLSRGRVDEMAPFLSCYNDCTAHELLMIGRQGGRRVFFKTTTPPQLLTEIEKIFADMRHEPAEQKYHLSKDIPGLEILFADDNLEAATLWKNGADFRVLAGAANRQEKIDREMEDVEEATEGEKDEAHSERIVKLRAQKELENISWFALEKNRLVGSAAQPPQVEYIPRRDGLPVAATSEQWKARAGNIEIRADSSGLYKVANGRLVKILSGDYDSPIITANGRWVVALKYTNDDGRTLVRVNLLTNKEYPFNGNEFSYGAPVAYIPSQNKVLVSMAENEGDDEDGDVSADDEDVLPANDELILADPETGSFQEARGEVRPLGQQTFRQLQPVAATPFEFWAAVPDLEKRETSVGIYNSRTFAFRPLLKIPKIVFGSMKMWVDEPEKKVYFIYRGQVLALPLGK